MRKVLALGFCLSAIMFLLVPAVDAAQYNVLSLGKLSGATSSAAYGVSNSGLMVGESSDYAVTWKMERNPPLAPYRPVITQLAMPGTPSTGWRGAAYSINDSGTAVGCVLNPGYYSETIEAYRWDATGAHKLSSPGSAMDINSSGVAAGGALGACVWDSAGAHPLGSLPDWSGRCARAINDNGQVVGSAWIYLSMLEQPDHAVLWDSSGAHDLGTLLNHTRSIATDINNAGTVVGYSDDAVNIGGVYGGDGKLHACLWDASGVRELAPLQGYQYALAAEINSAGIVVGRSISEAADVYLGFAPGQACYWDAAGVAHALPTLAGYSYSFAEGVNDSGWIVGGSFNTQSDCVATLWRPLPEPSSLLALLSGLAGIGGLAIRRRK